MTTCPKRKNKTFYYLCHIGTALCGLAFLAACYASYTHTDSYRHGAGKSDGDGDLLFWLLLTLFMLFVTGNFCYLARKIKRGFSQN